ncbi:Spo0B C-terminal domain-containing protein [Halalkalibacter urbisdiaboli]|uniref:Spo0B C-terminal domain-containing protein n=1 Tax=Halalkalibacter urbisdiaboli TaxID=1960589 RepID=UPI0013FE0D8C|nr:Spo0B C-terminal domain-containing protein [Halalkalibacter urbisdiaboli]
MTNQKDILEALRHTRHDWLNVMQLIKGNLALKRYDRIETIIETVTQKSINESKLSSMEAPAVAVYLLTYNWNCHALNLDIDIIGEVKSFASHEPQLLHLCESIIKQLTASSSKDFENTLLLTFLFKDNVCEITFDYHGKLLMKESDWEPVLKKLDPEVNLVEWDEHECVLCTCFTLN